ncbi:MAG: outer membrane lipoprotein carrier protein LolA [Desulfobacteraceae bacterium]|nr:outer membrane lipoprotein carrier protein LolA [Desulfobacteraceae bacterium]
MEKLEAILETAENNFSDVQTLKAKLIQEKNISLFSEPVISEGFFLFKNPDKIRLEFTTPFKSALFVNKDQFYRFEEIKGEWKAMSSGDKKITRIMLDHMAAWVKGRFNKDGLYRISGKYLFGNKPENPAAIILILEPKAVEFREFIRAFELGINADINRLEHITIRESEQDFTHIEFYDEQINMPIENNLFAPGKQGPVPVLW